MKKTLALLAATTALSAAITAPAWSAMRTSNSEFLPFAAVFEADQDAMPLILASSDDDDDREYRNGARYEDDDDDDDGKYRSGSRHDDDDDDDDDDASGSDTERLKAMLADGSDDSEETYQVYKEPMDEDEDDSDDSDDSDVDDDSESAIVSESDDDSDDDSDDEAASDDVGFDWDDDDGAEVVTARGRGADKKRGRDDADGTGATEKRSSKKKASAAAEAERERALMAAEARVAAPAADSMTVNDHERAVTTTPREAQPWFDYMLYHADADDVHKARAVLERALRAIPTDETLEREIIWLAYVNLEVSMGTKETLVDVATRGAKRHGHLKVWSRVAAAIFEQHSDASRAADIMLERVLSRPDGRQSVDAWVNVVQYLMTAKRASEVRETSRRASQSLSGSDMQLFTTRIASLEFRSGQAERGRSMFEQLVKQLPRRGDIWNVYIDCEMAHGDPVRAADLLNRATDCRLKERTMKTLFKKWVKLERERDGDIERVTAKAKAWIEKQAKK
jgi:rRNA biogenesis protein RRP5